MNVCFVGILFPVFVGFSLDAMALARAEKVVRRVKTQRQPVKKRIIYKHTKFDVRTSNTTGKNTSQWGTISKNTKLDEPLKINIVRRHLPQGLTPTCFEKLPQRLIYMYGLLCL